MERTDTGRTAYPPPESNPACRCYPDMRRAFWCLTGHMTECHYPERCAEANCSHMDRYEPEEDAEADDIMGDLP